MKVCTFVLVLVLAAPSPADPTEIQGFSPRNWNERALLKLMRDYYDSRMRRDAATLERILAKDFIGIPTGSGDVRDKRQRIKNLTHPDIETDFVKIDEVTIKFYGTTALIVSRVTMRSTSGGQSVVATRSGLVAFRSMMVCAKSNGRWQIVAAQGTAIPEQ